MEIEQKEYYRLNEVASLFGVEKEHLFYLAENGKLALSLHSKLDKYVFGGVHTETQKFVGLGVCEYRGLIQLQQSDLTNLLDYGQVEIGGCWLLQREKVKVIQTDYPFDIKCPNSLVSVWKPIDLEMVEWPTFYAKPLPSQEISAKKQLFSTLGGVGAQLAISAGKKVEETEELLERVGSMSDYVFSDKTRVLGIDNIRITYQALVGAGLVCQVVQEPEKAVSEIKGRKTEITMIVERLALAFPNLNHDKLWSELKRDLNRSEREYDIDNAILEMTDEHIKWINKKSEVCTYKIKSFKNKVSIYRRSFKQ